MEKTWFPGFVSKGPGYLSCLKRICLLFHLVFRFGRSEDPGTVGVGRREGRPRRYECGGHRGTPPGESRGGDRGGRREARLVRRLRETFLRTGPVTPREKATSDPANGLPHRSRSHHPNFYPERKDYGWEWVLNYFHSFQATM